MLDQSEGVTLRDEDWYGEVIADRRFVDCHLERIDLTEAVTQGVVFTGCTFGNVSFNASRHVDTAFTRCVFRRCTFFAAEFTGCKLVGSTFDQCDLRPLTVVGGDWSFVAFPAADLRGVRLVDVRMREADLTGVDLTGATVTGVDLSGAQLRHAKLSRADLRGSDLTNLDPTEVERAGAIVSAEQTVVIAQALGFQIG